MKNIILSITFALVTNLIGNAQQFVNYTKTDGLADNIVNSVAIDKQGNKWFGTRNGVSKFDGATWTKYTKTNGLVDSVVNSISIDTLGNKWFGTRNGVSKFDGTTWTNYKITDGLANNFVWSVAIDKLNNKWFGTFDGGLSKFDGTTSWTTYNGVTSGYVEDHRINSLTIDPKNNNLWMGCYRGGAAKFDGTTWTPYSNTAFDTISGYGKARSISYGNVRAITIDTLGGKWFGTTSFGISWLDKNDKWTRYHFSNPRDKEKNYINAIAVDKQGNKWFGTWGAGLMKFDGTTWTIYTTKNSNLIDDHIYSIAIDAQGIMWIGTYEGVSKMDPKITSINEVIGNSFQVFPNPATDMIFVNGAKANSTLSIYNVNGQEILKKILTENNQIDISALTKGVYLVDVTDENGMVTSSKIIKQ